MTYHGSVLALVVPAYEEEGFVGDVIEGTPEYVDRVYPVDDCSTDETWAEMNRAARRVEDRRTPTDPYDEVVVPLRHERNRGAGAAVVTGCRRALADDVDLVATMDGDGQMDPELLPALLDPVVDGRVAYAKGNRLDAIEHVGEMSAWRLIGNGVLTLLTRIATGYWHLRDPQNGFAAISAAALESLDLDSLYEHYGFRNDLLARLSVAGYRVADVAHPARYGEEESTIQYRSFVPRLSRLLLYRFCWRLAIHARRDGDLAVPASFLAGVGALVATPFLGGTDERGEPRADGGAVARRRWRKRWRSLPLVGSVLVVVGALLDARRRAGRVVRVDGRRGD